MEQINKIIQSEIDASNLPGANYAIITEDKCFFNSLGYRSLYKDLDAPFKEKNSLETVYDIASLSKVVSTTTCLLLLLEQGKVRLFDTVKKFLDDFPFDEITIYHLVTHTSGLKPCVPHQATLHSPEEAWDRLIKTELDFKPGTKLQYSCQGYITLGKVIEKISREPLVVFAKKNIFIPLKMHNTCYNPQSSDLIAPTEYRNDQIYKGFLRGKVHDETAFALNGVSGNAGVFSTIKDLSNFIQMILNDGMFEGKQFLSKSSIDLIFTPQIEEKSGIFLKSDIRTIGWIQKGSYPSCGDLASSDTILHTGFTGTNIFIDRTNKIGFCMLTNRVHPTRDNPVLFSLRPRVANIVIANINKFK